MGPSGLLTLPSRAPLQPTEPSGLLSELGSLHGHPPTDLPAQKVPSSFKLPPPCSRELRSPRPAISGQSLPTGPPRSLPTPRSPSQHGRILISMATAEMPR